MNGSTGSDLMFPFKMGPFHLSHRVVLAPMTRCRALNTIPQPAHVTYYSQRTTPGGLLITEAVSVGDRGFGFPHSPGIFTDEQIHAWKAVVDAVHARGGIIFCQIWHVGRASHKVYQPNGDSPVSSTSRKISDDWKIQMLGGTLENYSTPRALATSEIKVIVQQFREAARNAMIAGFDGVEIHAGHGYLIDQFMKNKINDRMDEYGGSIENRCRFALEILSAVTEEIGTERTAIRISPVVDHLDALDSDPMALGLYLAAKLNHFGLCYMHLTQPRYNARKVKKEDLPSFHDCHSLMRNAYKGTLMSTGGYTRESGMAAIRNGEADLISYGRLFISNPDLPWRFRLGAVKLNKYDRATFYTHDQVVGYTDYPFLYLEDDKRGRQRSKMISNEGSLCLRSAL
ncbi:hypothetical protein SUGI_0903670 [Cryptomeria japonica]|uniref:putative 12-oxophytodienoate reductase 11 n=1 Tax=Cryptomeria japonica TaxID=3369 RepID=UPI0024149B3C|nr:putative 12-oxophytodienoate reductase 11 [Cryptomeria japonica]GLJ43464.1 hypothetical protein SUGI_0903670 [Cryptomeria japonica]